MIDHYDLFSFQQKTWNDYLCLKSIVRYWLSLLKNMDWGQNNTQRRSLLKRKMEKKIYLNHKRARALIRWNYNGTEEMRNRKTENNRRYGEFVDSATDLYMSSSFHDKIENLAYFFISSWIMSGLILAIECILSRVPASLYKRVNRSIHGYWIVRMIFAACTVPIYSTDIHLYHTSQKNKRKKKKEALLND